MGIDRSEAGIVCSEPGINSKAPILRQKSHQRVELEFGAHPEGADFRWRKGLRGRGRSGGPAFSLQCSWVFRRAL